MTSNKTQYYRLPLYIATDRIDPILDFNGAMAKLDASIHDISTMSGSAGTIADAAKRTAEEAIATANTSKLASDANTVLVEGIKQWENAVNAMIRNAQSQPITIFTIQEGEEAPGTVDITAALQSGNLQQGDVIIVQLSGTSGVPFWAPGNVYFAGDNNYQLFDILNNVVTAIDDYKIHMIRVIQAMRFTAPVV